MVGIAAVLNTLFASFYAIIENRLSKGVRISISVFLVIIFAVIVAFRPHYIPDTLNYINIFNIADTIKFNSSSSLVNSVTDMEWGFIYFIKLIKVLGLDNYIVFFLIIPIVNTIFVCWGSKKIIQQMNANFIRKDQGIINSRRVKSGIVLAVYFSYYGLMHNAITLRAGFSLSLSVVVLGYFMEKKYLKSFLLFLLALSFHSLSVLILIVALIYKFLPKFPSCLYYAILTVNGIFLLINSRTILTSFIIDFSVKISNHISIIRPFIRYLYNNTEFIEFSPRNIFIYILSWYFLIYRIENDIYAKIYNVFLLGVTIMLSLNNILGINRIYDYFIFYTIILQYSTYEFRSKKTILDKSIFMIILIIFTVFALRTMTLI